MTVGLIIMTKKYFGQSHIKESNINTYYFAELFLSIRTRPIFTARIGGFLRYTTARTTLGGCSE